MERFGITCCPWFRCRSQMMHSHACPRRKDMPIIIIVIINSQTGKEAGRSLEVNWVDEWCHFLKKWPKNFGIMKKGSWCSTVEAGGWGFFLSDQIDKFEFQLAEMSWDHGHYKMRRACVCVWGGSALYVYYRLFGIVSLSSCRQGLKAERNKPVRIRNDKDRLYYYWNHHGIQH